ncbi:hypothetical protein A3768_4664 (plasmid) [Ralstonia solanacearum]|nr:hypothetical protein A3768_4664 [Ralstonia solanacearum]
MRRRSIGGTAHGVPRPGTFHTFCLTSPPPPRRRPCDNTRPARPSSAQGAPHHRP